MTTKLTKKGALSVTAVLDRVAELFEQDAETLGVDPKIAKDFAYRCDLLSDFIDKKAGLNRKALTELDVVQEAGFDPENIGEEKAGPLVGDADEPYMKGNFGQEENRELRYDQEQGKIGPDKTVEDQKPLQPGKQAGYDNIGKQAAVNQLSRVEGLLHDAALRFAKAGNVKVAGALTALAHSVMNAQVGVFNGTRTAADIGQLIAAVNTLLPHVAAVNENAVDTVVKMAGLAVKVAKKAEEDEGEVPEDEDGESKKGKKGKKSEEDEEAKKSEDDKPDFLKDKEDEKEGKKGKKSEDDKPDFLKDKEDEKEGKKGKKSEDEPEDKPEEGKKGKKAGHGFILDAE